MESGGIVESLRIIIVIGGIFIGENGVELELSIIACEVFASPLLAQVLETIFRFIAAIAIARSVDEKELFAIRGGIDFGVIIGVGQLRIRVDILGNRIGFRQNVAIGDGEVGGFLAIQALLRGIEESASGSVAPAGNPVSDIRNRENDGENSTDDEQGLNPCGFFYPTPYFNEEGTYCF